jgi:hypothetical protein
MMVMNTFENKVALVTGATSRKSNLGGIVDRCPEPKRSFVVLIEAAAQPAAEKGKI